MANKWKNNFSSKYVIFESAIIFETGSYEKFDFNILVLSDIEKRIKRVIKNFIIYFKIYLYKFFHFI